jgi:carbamoyl-phosphate synthase small subunit
MQDKKAKLVLEDGSRFEGIPFGCEKSVSGEVVFNTGMTGYPESLTDPSYSGQILVLTYPLIGNYGVPKKEKIDGLIRNFESEKIQVKGLIVSHYSQEPSHWSCQETLDDWLKEEGIPALQGIPTRTLTMKLREKGTMLGKIVAQDIDVPFYDPNKENLVQHVSANSVKEYGKGKKTIVLIDCGVKNSILGCLLERNVKVIRVPWDYDFLNLDCDGIVISNGPGDPKMCPRTIENVKKALEKDKPLFGICLGNQILALAAGMDTYKLKYGHRSQNQPCLEIESGRCFITSQNHGFAVKPNFKEGWEEWFVNANDGTNEGIRHKGKPFMAVQFHPEGSPGPRDTEFLFDEFLKEIG